MDEWLSIAETAHLHRDSTKVSKMLSTSLGGDDKLTSFAISQVCCCFCGLFVVDFCCLHPEFLISEDQPDRNRAAKVVDNGV